ncbi:MarR family winged helix-turn-helix transcriptional regulator [Arsenicicoccus sp. oral taxon 190]|uniref:MarR family winged helix-turn-helix transcriptional regulator n=1 Tax=Arsenicicoccus sp. oral taxon 190 TaxID=1658671 RepID=UPI00067C6453|nr:MarR family winged helix-turn-helix transcriptional regulator [Arsenicicoccus sp. oral taxon 190]
MDTGDVYRLARQLRSLAVQLSTHPGETASPSEIAVVEHLVRAGESSVGAVAQGTSLSQAAVSKVVAALVEADLATSRRDPVDRRRTLVTLRPSAVDDIRGRGRRALAAELRRLQWSESAADQLTDTLHQLQQLLSRAP